ncbi:MAG TPA: class F sortase [Candidatus Dormibacteraeota bacterium]|nr:class F sortase [Candidatus Dormibacteraeota bacterium]
MRNFPARGRILWVLLGLGAAVIVLGAGLLVGAHRAPTAARPPALAGSPTGPSGVQPSAQPSAAPPQVHFSPAKSAFVPFQLVIQRLNVEAPVEIKGVDSHNVMESPSRPFDVAWYNFTAKPGAGHNAVFAGHLDYWGVGPAVFWNLRNLRPGDTIAVISGQQTGITYRVTQSWDYTVSNIPMASVLESGRQDEITLITCAGAFHNGGYDHRLVVRAVRVS